MKLCATQTLSQFCDNEYPVRTFVSLNLIFVRFTAQARKVIPKFVAAWPGVHIKCVSIPVVETHKTVT